MENKLTIREYFEKKNFVVPNYQRGYKWGVKDKQNKCAVSIIINDLMRAFNRSNEQEYFIEAITVVENPKNVVLVDGQQRTTTLFLLFLALGELEFLKDVSLIYNVREDSHIFLNNLTESEDEKIKIIDEDTQDIFYFKLAIKTINEEIEKEIEKNDKFDKTIFLDFLKEKVCLLYNVIEENKALTTFISLNGLKAEMKDEELIKSDLLIKSSRIEENKKENLTDDEKLGFEWKINEDRNRLAHNWDKWLYWWNNEDVKKYFGTGIIHPLYYLLVTYRNIKVKSDDKNKKFDFDNFKSEFIGNSVSAKNTFEELRKLQKSFEDLYNNPISYNFLGIALKTSFDKEKAITYFLKNKQEKKQKEYAFFVLVNSTHLENVDKTKEKDEVIETRVRKVNEAIDSINRKFVYNSEGNEFAFRFLLLLNVLEDNKLNRKFNFNIWNERSLEHIHPKSKAYHKEGERYRDGNNVDLGLSEPISNDWINRDKITGISEHCIGNLVLLYGRNNSTFGAKTFQEKKQTYFETSNDLKFESKSLLHTLSIFAKSEWNEEAIAENKIKIINNLENIYNEFY